MQSTGDDKTQVRPCPKCGVPFDPGHRMNDWTRHLDNCIGETPFVLHNRESGVVVYLTEMEWMALHQREDSPDFDRDRLLAAAEAVGPRVVWGVTPA